MKYSTVFISLLIILLPTLAHSQENLERGFQMLELGHYGKAKTFFSEYLEMHKNDRTAMICYGRAVGLEGDPENAVIHFQDMTKRFGNDPEIKLNLAEAFLWNNEPLNAIRTFEELLKKDSSRFEVNFGYANALSSSGRHKEGLAYINKALAIKDTESVRVSKKYIMLARAGQLRDIGSYREAQKVMEFLQNDFPDDRDILMAKTTLLLFQQKYQKARKLFRMLIDKGIDSLDAQRGYAYVSSVMKRKKASIISAEMVLEASQSGGDSLKVLNAEINLVNTLGTLGSFKKAHTLLDTINAHYGPTLPGLLTKGRLYVWEGHYQKALHVFNELETSFPDAYEVFIGKAEALISLQMNKKALEYIQKAISADSIRMDAKWLLNRLKGSKAAVIDLSGSLETENKQNLKFSSAVRLDLPEKGSLRPYAAFRYTALNNQQDAGSAEWIQFNGGLGWKPSYRISVKAEAGAVFIKGGNYNKNYFSGNLGLWFKLNARQNLAVIANHHYYDYSSIVIREGVKYTDFTLNYDAIFFSNLGLFTQVGTSVFTDGNIKNRIFSSVYYRHINFPEIKAGLNLNAVIFKRSVPEIYFSPEKYLSMEVFTLFQKTPVGNQRLMIKAELAAGVYSVNDADWQPAFRWSLGLSFKCTGRLTLEADFRNNHSVNQFTGANTFTKGEIKLKYRL